ncbi:WD40 repeat-like protein [Auriscalpium vulgare]|uniref:WD40 repeat-like protein n=1 Tax=Auriscalpium vulgare TaxID=40419 RepID=A0ACB8RUU3_9AGAM|nr:WD40 repeat-like protein [Auriscalpium vulgare]
MGIFSSLRRRSSKVCADASSGRSSSPPVSTFTDVPLNHAIPENEKYSEGDSILPGAGKEAPRTQAKGQSCKCAPPPTGQRGRNLVVCIDGTANQFSIKNTNVVELYSRLEKDVEQLTYYDSGIGTYVRDSKWSPGYWKQAASHAIDMAIAWNFKKIVLSAYQWLSENYQEGDKIFLFGFSRGAYQVRVIAGMIEKVGLLHKGNNNQIPFAYELYVSTTSNQMRSDRKKPGHPKTKKKNAKTAKDQEALCFRFKQTLSRRDVRVHFVGAWDTVSSIGVARGPSLPETTTGMTHVCVFRHALALDEKRCKFLPEYANGGDGLPFGDGAVGDVKEVWFVGSHSDIGGGNIPNLELDHFGAALRWMSYEAITHGLRMSSRRGEWQSFPPNLALSWVWKIIEILPLRRLSYKDGDSTTRRPHLCLARSVKKGQMIHESVLQSILHGRYKPLAHLPDGFAWDRETLDGKKMLEGDPYASALIALPQLEAATKQGHFLSSEHRDALTTLASSEIGRESLADAQGAGDILFHALVHEQSYPHTDSEAHRQSITALAAAMTAVPSRPSASATHTRAQVRKLFSAMENTPANQTLIAGIMENTFRKIMLCRGHTHEVNSVAFSPGGRRVVSGSEDGTLRIWDAQTGETVGAPFKWHTSSVRSVAFCPDGKRVASGSVDQTIRIWDAQTGETMTKPFRGHKGWVQCVAFSPDGKRVVSSSADQTIRIWDAQTGMTVAGPFTVLTKYNLSVAFSPDGKHVASSSDDQTVRIWDAETGETVAGPFTGHTSSVWSVAFSPDGKRVASGSADGTIRIWDSRTGETVAGPFTGHTSYVWSVAFSPDGKRVVSGSHDATIRIWDAQTGETVVGPLTGHTRWVRSVGYSPDGKLVVSGSEDGTVRIWDAEID